MVPEVKDWEFQAIQRRYQATHGLRLTFEQAEKIYEFEQVKDMPSDKHYFSIWEELDFEYTTFADILSPEQFDTYKLKHQELIRLNEHQLAQQDQEYSSPLESAKELLLFYENTLVPEIATQRLKFWNIINGEQEKIEYLKAEYRKYLTNRRKFILSDHFRNGKTLQPRLLQLSLLNHKMCCLVPDYSSFRASMDQPTTVVAEYLETKLKKVAMRIIDPLNNALKILQERNREHDKNDIKGWHVTVANEEDNLMFLVLFDPEKYADC